MLKRRDFIQRATAFAVAGLVLPACAKTSAKIQGGKGMAKVKVDPEQVAIVYFSWSGNTKFVAETFAKTLSGAKIAEIKPIKPYATDYGTCCDEATPECRGRKSRAVQPIEGLDLSAYDVVLVGSPNWWGTMAPPVRTWISDNLATLKTKTVCLFQTHGGGGMQNLSRDFAELLDGAKVLPAKAYSGSSVRRNATLGEFLTERFEFA